MEYETFAKLVKRLKIQGQPTGVDTETVDTVILAAFGQLSVETQMSVICRHVQHSEINGSPGAVVKTPEIEAANQLEMIRLKSWLIKIITISALLCFTAFFVIMFYVNSTTSGTSEGGMSEYFEDIVTILRLLFFDSTS